MTPLLPTLPLQWAPTLPYQVIGESDADGNFVKAVAEAHGVPPFEFTTPRGSNNVALGKSGLGRHLKAMRAFVDRQQISRIAVLGDCDEDHATSFAAIRKAIRDAGGYPTPHVQPCQMATSQGFGIGVIMIPGASENGCLETLLLKSSTTGTLSATCLMDWITCSGFPTHKKTSFDKFRVRSILAATIVDDPNVSLAWIWSKPTNPFTASDPAYKWIADFLKTAFS